MRLANALRGEKERGDKRPRASLQIMQGESRRDERERRVAKNERAGGDMD